MLPFQSQLFLVVLFLRKININTLEIQKSVWNSFFVSVSIILKGLTSAICKALIPDKQQLVGVFVFLSMSLSLTVVIYSVHQGDVQ